jgi:hypothetical protein
VLTGKGSKVTDPLQIPPGKYRVTWQATTSDSSELFNVWIQGQGRDLLVNEVLPKVNHGEALFNSGGGSFIIEVKGNQSTWQMTFTWLSA